MHVQAHDFVAAHVDGLGAVDVLEIGSCDVNGSVRPLFPEATSYHGLDIVAGPGVDEVADAAAWRPGGERFDVVVSTEVLEHAPRWRDILQNAWDGLRPGGRLVFTFATDPRPPHSAVDGWEVRPGEHYANVGADELLTWLRGVDCREHLVEVHRDRGDCYLVAVKPTS